MIRCALSLDNPSADVKSENRTLFLFPNRALTSVVLTQMAWLGIFHLQSSQLQRCDRDSNPRESFTRLGPFGCSTD